ncbi:hypothetical protein ACP6IB_26960 [Vibrio harveyi]|uniref:hypothetical protein n=1 Tax=Vibrio harveyi TaxID=669 RepID=UPI003CF0A168
MAFLLCVGFSDLGGMRRHRYCVAHPLTGRYMITEIFTTEVQVFKEVILYVKKNKLVNVAFLLAVSLIVSFQISKSMPVWFDWDVSVVNYYYDIGVNLSIGYIVSTIFYILVVYYPERKRCLAIKAKTSILFARLQNNLYEFIDSVLTSANVELRYGEDIENSYQKKLEELDLISLMRNTTTYAPFGDYVSCLDKAIKSAKYIEQLKTNLIPFIIYLDDKELELYLELEDNFIFENFGDEEQLFIKEHIIKNEFHFLVAQFNACQRIVGAQFREVSWQEII